MLEVTVKGQPDPVTGYLIDLAELKRILHAAVVDRCDHRNLNEEVDFLRDIIPSTENLVIAFWNEIAPHIRAGRLHCVRLYETPRNFAEYFGPRPAKVRCHTTGPTVIVPTAWPPTPNKKNDMKKKQMYLHRSADGTTPKLKRGYDTKFRVSNTYRASLPDMMESAHDAIHGVNVPIQQVGVSNFKLPLKFRTKQGKLLTLEASITGTVSLEAELKGINMSRIVRSFYDHKDDVFTGEWVGKILKAYLRKVQSKDARLKIGFSYPMIQRSLRSGPTATSSTRSPSRA